MNKKVNGRIKAEQVKVIMADFVDLGVMSLTEAMALARSRGEDLVEVQPDLAPPVCEVIDYGKYRFRLQKARKAKKREE